MRAIEPPRARLEEFCRLWKITELALFGSVLRDDFGPQSDVDVLVTFAEDAHHSLFEISLMRDELQRIFGRKVDLVEKAAIRNPFRRASILGSLEVMYAA